MYDIVISKSAKRSFLDLPEEIQERVAGVLERISIQPYKFVRRLSASSAYRVRVGKYRVILDINQCDRRDPAASWRGMPHSITTSQIGSSQQAAVYPTQFGNEEVKRIEVLRVGHRKKVYEEL